MSLHSNLVISRNADIRTRIPRTQREAGLEFHQWAERMTPRASVLEQLAQCTAVAIIVVGLVAACIGIAQ